MYPGVHAKTTPDKAAVILATGGQVVTYRALDERSNQGAHLLRSLGLRRGDHIAICMENNAHYHAICWAAQRSGIYYTTISTRLTAPEAEYIVDDCDAKVFVTSRDKAELAGELLGKCPKLLARYAVNGDVQGYERWETAAGEQPECVAPRVPRPGTRAPHLLGSVDALRARLPLAIPLGADRFVVREHAGRLVAHSATCPHWGASLAGARIEDGAVVCPWHGYRYDLVTGRGPASQSCRMPARASVRVSERGEAWLVIA